MSIQDNSKDSIDAIIANTSIHDCDDSTYEVHVSAATLHLLSQLRDNLTKGLNIYSLIEATMLKYAESHATKDFMLVKSSQAYKHLSESTNKELVELRQLVEVLKKENDELRIELNALRDKDNGYVLKEAPNIEHSSEHTVTISDEDTIRIREGIVVENDPVEDEPIVINTSDIPHSSEDRVTISDEDVESIRGKGTINTIKGKGFDTTVSITRDDSDDSDDSSNVSDKQLESWANDHRYKSRPLLTFPENQEKLIKHPNPNGVGNGVYVSTGKPENNTAEKIHVTKYSEIEETKI